MTMDRGRAAPSSPALAWQQGIYPSLPATLHDKILPAEGQMKITKLLLAFLSTERTHGGRLTCRTHCTSSKGS